MSDTVGGTVIQRTFIGRDTTEIVHIATVPIEELQLRAHRPEAICADLLGIPESSVLTSARYQQIRGRIPPRLIFPVDLGEEFQTELVSALTEESPLHAFADFIGLCASPGQARALEAWQLVLLNRLSRAYDIRQEELGLAMQCVGSRLTRSDHSEQFLSEMLSYDIPLGQSPAVKSDSLLKLLETSKSFCIAPLALGGAQAVTQLSQGNYVAAMLTTGTGSAMTLVLIGTVAVGSLIVQRVAQTRGRG